MQISVSLGYWQLAMGYWLFWGYWLLAMGYWLFLGLWAMGDGRWAIGYWRWDFKERIILPIELISTSNISRISLDM